MKTESVSPSRKNRIKGNSGFNTVVVVTLTLFALFAAIPFWMVIINSFTTEISIARNGFLLWPREWSLSAYSYVFTGRQIYFSYQNTLIVVGVGVPCALTITTMFAYVLAHPKIRYKRQISFITYFTMLMGTSLVGYYMLIANWLGLKDSRLALILPRMMNPFNAFILVAAFRDVPLEIYEASCVDGSGELRTFFTIMIPMILPSIATIALFFALLYWNDWWLALMFIDNYKLYPLQMMLKNLISEVNAAAFMGGEMSSGVLPSNTMKMAVVCLTIGPIVLVYPFIQRYFIAGITAGAVKG